MSDAVFALDLNQVKISKIDKLVIHYACISV